MIYKSIIYILLIIMMTYKCILNIFSILGLINILNITGCDAFISPTTPFNSWHCVDFIKNIDTRKPHAFNIGELPLVVWFNSTLQPITTVNVCSHMGSKLDKGKINNGCLTCPYHGLEHNDKHAFGNSMIFEDKLWWSYEPIKKTPPKVPFYNNKKYATTNIKIDVDANIVDCAFNTMDLNHPAFVHNNMFGFGSNVPPENIETYKYNDDKIGLAFTYKSNSNLAHLKNGLKKSKNFHIYEYPYTSWSRVSLPNGEHLIVNVNLLPIGPNKTRWFVTLKYNYWNKYPYEKLLMEFAARCILFQDQLQLSKQSMENALKRMVVYQEIFDNEEHIEDLKKMFKKYQYPDNIHVMKLYKCHKYK